MRIFPMLLLAGCVSYKPATTPPAPLTFAANGTRASIAERVTRFLGDQGIAVTSTDTGAGLITARDIPLPLDRLKQWVNCGTVNGAPAVEHRNAAAYTGSGSLTVSVSAAAEVRPVFDVRVTAPMGGIGGAVLQQCVSSGGLERALRDAVR